MTTATTATAAPVAEIVTDPENHPWRYKVLYFTAGGSSNFYWTDSKRDANKVADERNGMVIGPLDKAWWKRARPDMFPDDAG